MGKLSLAEGGGTGEGQGHWRGWSLGGPTLTFSPAPASTEPCGRGDSSCPPSRWPLFLGWSRGLPCNPTCSPQAVVAELGGCCLPLPGSRWGEAGARAWPAPGMLWPHSQNPALGVCLLLRPRGLVLL